MIRGENKNVAIQLRKNGWSYTQIKDQLGISKSTLSGWLRDFPLSEERINELRKPTDIRIERIRNTKAKNKLARQNSVFNQARKDIGKISDRDIFVAGLFLYWGEGGKTLPSTTSLTNTNPAILKFFIAWLISMNVPIEKLKVRLQIYNDMDCEVAVTFWSNSLGISKSQFMKLRVKKSLSSSLTYKNGFGKGTCTVIYESRDITEYILQSLKVLQSYL